MDLKRRAHATSKLREEMTQSFHNYVVESKARVWFQLQFSTTKIRCFQAAGSPRPSLVSQVLDTLSQDNSVNDTEAEKLAKDIGSFMYLGEYLCSIRSGWNLLTVTCCSQTRTNTDLPSAGVDTVRIATITVSFHFMFPINADDDLIVYILPRNGNVPPIRSPSSTRTRRCHWRTQPTSPVVR